MPSSIELHPQQLSDPHTNDGWILLKSMLLPKIIVLKTHSQQIRIWLTFALLSFSGLLYLISVFRALYLKRYYLMKRDSRGNWSPHLCLLVSLVGIAEVAISMIDVVYQDVRDQHPFQTQRFIINQFALLFIYCLAGLRTWGMWCAMPPSALQFRISSKQQWQKCGPWIIMTLQLGFFLTIFILSPFMIKAISDSNQQWSQFQSGLDQILQSNHDPSSHPSSSLELETLKNLLNLKSNAHTFLFQLRLFSTILSIFISLLFAMFAYASITILRALSLQIQLIRTARSRSRMVLQLQLPHPSSSHQLSPSLTPTTKLAWLDLILNLLRKEAFDCDTWNTPLSEPTLRRQDVDLQQKIARLRRHWWRVLLQFGLGTAISLSYFILAFCVAVNAWKLGDQRFFTEIEADIDEWRNWTWVSGPGILMASITCAISFSPEESKDPSITLNSTQNSLGQWNYSQEELNKQKKSYRISSFSHSNQTHDQFKTDPLNLVSITSVLHLAGDS